MTAAERSDARNVQQDTSTPRLVYRGKQDILGLGMHTDPETGELIGENKKVETQEELEEAQTDGWRLTSADPDAAPPEVDPFGRGDSTPGRPHPDHDLPGRPAGPARPKAKR